MSSVDPSVQAKLTRRSKDEEVRRRNFINGAMRSEEGKAFFWDMLERCNVFGNCFAPENPALTNFKLGERNVGLMLFAEITQASETNVMELMRYGQRRTGKPGNTGNSDPGDDSADDSSDGA